MKLIYKFFIAFFVSSFLIVLLVIGVTQINVRRNFIKFVNNTEFDKLDTMTALLKESYQKEKGWAAFKGNETAWYRLIKLSHPDDRTPPPFHKLPGVHYPGPKGKPGQKNLPKPLDPYSLHRRLCLFDENKKYVAGIVEPENKLHFRAIVVSGETIGWLGLKNQANLVKPIELEFLKNQTQSFYMIAAGILILAVFISMILSRHLLHPVKELMKGTNAIRNFDFTRQIQIRSKDELGELARDFNLMIQTLKEYETLRKNWISDISHELRTPVAVIRSKIEALQDGVRTVTDEFLNSLHADILEMGQLVNNLHMISLADSENLQFNPVKLNMFKILDRSVEDFYIRFEQKQISIETDWGRDDQLNITADKGLLTRAFNNLMENSLRYTHEQGHFKISHIIQNKKLLLTFEDSAPGVPEKEMEYIFKRLYRVEQSRNRSFGGSGLGLSIVKQIISRHEGSVSAEQSSLGGLKIMIELPVL